MACACGCGAETSPGRRFVRGHARRVGGPPRREDHGYATPCLIWPGRPSAQGYGRTSVDGRIVPAHVAAWERVNGPVPSGREIDHLCYVRMCVELTHLECVTAAENRSRASKRYLARRYGHQ